jgi:hypothetical protein
MLALVHDNSDKEFANCQADYLATCRRCGETLTEPCSSLDSVYTSHIVRIFRRGFQLNIAETNHKVRRLCGKRRLLLPAMRRSSNDIGAHFDNVDYNKFSHGG